MLQRLRRKSMIKVMAHSVPSCRRYSHEEKSFVELGGDISALAITLLYKLRVGGLLSDSLDLSSADITESDTIRELRQIVSGETKVKREKINTPVLPVWEPFVPCAT